MWNRNRPPAAAAARSDKCDAAEHRATEQPTPILLHASSLLCSSFQLSTAFGRSPATEGRRSAIRKRGDVIRRAGRRLLAGATVCALAASLTPAPARASDPIGDALQALARDMTFGWAKAHPLEATSLGLSDEDGDLDTPSAAENADDLATIRAWNARLVAIPLTKATLAEADDAKLLDAQLVVDDALLDDAPFEQHERLWMLGDVAAG